MKRSNKNLVLILILAVIILFAGCSNIRFKTSKNSDIQNSMEENENPEDENIENIDKSEADNNENHEVLIDDVNSSDSNETTPTVIQPIENIELLIYIVNSSAELEAVPALVPADVEITPQLIVDTVVDSMADRSLIIGVESVTTQDDTVIVSFYKDQPPLTNVGSGFEYAILNAIAQSLTDNLEDYRKVIYRAEGGPYTSGHIELGLDEVYFEDTQ